jgi:hypothetical protein
MFFTYPAAGTEGLVGDLGLVVTLKVQRQNPSVIGPQNTTTIPTTVADSDFRLADIFSFVKDLMDSSFRMQILNELQGVIF